MIQTLNGISVPHQAQPQSTGGAEQIQDDEVAREFSKLIRKVRGATLTTPDECSAFAMALSQVTPISPRVVAPPEPSKKSDDVSLGTPSATPAEVGDGMTSQREQQVEKVQTSTPQAGEHQDADVNAEQIHEIAVELIPHNSAELSGESLHIELFDAELPVPDGEQESLRNNHVEAGPVVVQSDGEAQPLDLSIQEAVYMDQPTELEQGVGQRGVIRKGHDVLEQKDLGALAKGAEDLPALEEQGTTPQEQRATAVTEDISRDARESSDLEEQLKPTVVAPTPSTESRLAMPSRPTASAKGDQAIQSLIVQQQTALSQAASGSLQQRDQVTAGRPSQTSVSSADAMSNAGKARGDATRGARALARPISNRLLERVEAVLKEAVRSKDGKTLSFRIEPSDLGKIKVAVSFREGSLHARLTPESQRVVEALRDRAHELQASLRKLGLDVDSVTVTVSSDKSGEFAANSGMTGDGQHSARDGNKMPGGEAQVVDIHDGNDLAESSEVSQQGQRLPAPGSIDHWVA